MVIKHTGLEVEITNEYLYIAPAAPADVATSSSFMFNFNELDKRTETDIRKVVKDFKKSFRRILDICNI